MPDCKHGMTQKGKCRTRPYTPHPRQCSYGRKRTGAVLANGKRRCNSRKEFDRKVKRASSRVRKLGRSPTSDRLLKKVQTMLRAKKQFHDNTFW